MGNKSTHNINDKYFIKTYKYVKMIAIRDIVINYKDSENHNYLKHVIPTVCNFEIQSDFKQKLKLLPNLKPNINNINLDTYFTYFYYYLNDDSNFDQYTIGLELKDYDFLFLKEKTPFVWN